jgi:hypothetical protein
MQVTVTFDYPAGFDAAIEELEKMRPVDPTRAPDGTASATATPAPTTDADVVRIHRQMEPNESQRFLEALTSAPLTFAELAARMPKPDGTTHSNASMRAIHRNVRRQEHTLIKRGVIADHVVQWNFDNYDADAAGRYYLAPDAVAALDAHLGR